MRKLTKCFLGLALASAMSCASAGAIFSATSATINSGGPGSGSINNTFDQSGLSIGYTSGVTDFDTYLAGNPLHSTTFPGLEWFSNQDENFASVTYNLGSLRNLDALALWNEEASGIGLLSLFGSTDGVNFSLIVDNLSPTDHAPGGTDYGANVFTFGNVSAQYIRFDMNRCPQPLSAYNACSIGEVAFREAPDTPTAVPEPAMIGLFSLGLGAAALARRRRKS